MDGKLMNPTDIKPGMTFTYQGEELVVTHAEVFPNPEVCSYCGDDLEELDYSWSCVRCHRVFCHLCGIGYHGCYGVAPFM